MLVFRTALVGCLSLLFTFVRSQTLDAAGEAPHTRRYFYVGGGYVDTPDGKVFQNQMYVERLSPASGPKRQFPIVFLHGGGQSGTNWLNKPDGGIGWASRFLSAGYEVYIADETARGRSPWYPGSGFPQSVFTAEFISQRFTAIRNATQWPQAKLHTQWPGTGLIDDPIFTTFYASNMQFISSTVEQEITTRDAGIALLEKINRPAFLITHSQGGLYGWTIADSRPHLVRGLIQLEPKGPPFEEAVFTTSFLRPWGLTSIPLKFDNEDAPPPLATAKVTLNSPDLVPYCVIQADPPRQLPNLAKVPILIVTAEASYHAMYDTCFVKFLNQAGVQRVEHWNLGDRGIHGNAHMMFMEKNSDEIASKLDAWMRAK